jgi:hypothetical protein
MFHQLVTIIASQNDGLSEMAVSDGHLRTVLSTKDFFLDLCALLQNVQNLLTACICFIEVHVTLACEEYHRAISHRWTRCLVQVLFQGVLTGAIIHRL